MCFPDPPRAVIFDLDGTLVQTREASWKVFEKISATYDLGIDKAEQFYELFADNFFVSLRALCGTAERADQVEADFMEMLRTDYQPLMIPGMVDVVKSLVPHATLAVLSSNSTEVVRRILTTNSLAYCFAHVFGGDVEPDKTKGISRFLGDAAQGSGRRCEAFYDESPVGQAVSPQSTVIITDTVGDVEAAVRSGIRSVGVAWGMHTEEQLLAAGAEFVAIWPQEIISYLFAGASSGDAECSCTSAIESTMDSQLAAAGTIRTSRRRTTGPTPPPHARATTTEQQPRSQQPPRPAATGGTSAELTAAMKLMMA